MNEMMSEKKSLFEEEADARAERVDQDLNAAGALTAVAAKMPGGPERVAVENEAFKLQERAGRRQEEVVAFRMAAKFEKEADEREKAEAKAAKVAAKAEKE